jgi:predicted membrane protein
MQATRIRSRGHRHQHAGHRILFGIAVIGIGVLALLDNLHLFDLPLLKTFWPLGLTLWGLGRVVSGRHYGQWLFGIALALFGVLLTASHLGLLQFRPRDWWPVLIILVGLSILLRGVFPRFRPAVADATDTSTLEHGESVNIDASFSGVNQQNDSRNFKGGRIDVTFGGVELDLRQAVMAGPEVVLDISARFSGVELRVPREWQIVVDIAPTLGGVDDKTVPPMNPTQRLVLRGSATFAGVEIKN